MKKSTQSTQVAVGTGLVTLAAAAAGVYFLYGSKDASKKRKQIKSWMLKMKAEVLEKLEKAKDINEEMYHTVIADATKKYETLKNVDPAEVAVIAKELTSQWKAIKTVLNPAPKKKAKKVVKKASANSQE